MKFQQLSAINFFVLLVINLYSCSCDNEQNPIVMISTGKLRGEILLDWHQSKFYSFQSIPFAKPPIGKLRFKAPVPVESWDGILDALNPSPVCPQFDFNELIGQEDCLYLNVYTKTLKQTRNLPVMVYVHGGAYIKGSGNSQNYGAHFLLTEDIVLVTIAYRLGYLGALSFVDQTQGVPGNAHMKDQVMALKWVRENIHVFGGNPNLVTLFGESVGGASVHMQALSPMSHGLVHRVIAQSGCALNIWNYGILGTGDKIAEKLGFAYENITNQISKLQEMPMEEFLRKTQSPGEMSVEVHVRHEFSPVIETQTNEPAFLPESQELLISKAPKNIPIMMGYNNNDTLIMQVMRLLYKGEMLEIPDLNQTIPWDLDISKKQRSKLIKRIKSTFFKENSPGSIVNIINYYLGALLISGYSKAIEKHLQAEHTLYVYIFSSDTRLNFFKRLHPITAKYKGASHMDELGYLFTTQSTPCLTVQSPEGKAWRKLVRLWTNFAKYGKPIHDESEEWEPVTNEQNIHYVEINGDTLHPRQCPNQKIFDFWRNVYKEFSPTK